MPKKKPIEYDVTEKGCWECTSHSKNSKGYPKATFNYKTVSLHKYMYEQKHGKVPFGLCLLHKCDNPACINPDHLKIGTHKDNSQDMVKKGRSNKGSDRPQSKLTEEQVLKIRKLQIPCKDIAKIFNISSICVTNIKKFRRWKYLKPDTKGMQYLKGESNDNKGTNK